MRNASSDLLLIAALARTISPSVLPELDRRAEYASAATFIRDVLNVLDRGGYSGWWNGISDM